MIGADGVPRHVSFPGPRRVTPRYYFGVTGEPLPLPRLCP